MTDATPEPPEFTGRTFTALTFARPDGSRLDLRRLRIDAQHDLQRQRDLVRVETRDPAAEMIKAGTFGRLTATIEAVAKTIEDDPEHGPMEAVKTEEIPHDFGFGQCVSVLPSNVEGKNGVGFALLFEVMPGSQR